MDKKNEQTKNVFKQNILENASNLSYKLNPQIIKTSKQIRKISFLKNKRNALFPYDDEEIEINKDYVYEFLRKAPGARTFKDLQNVAEYLSKNYKYFSKIKKEEGTKKLENITKICRLEFFKKGSTIIKLGDIGEKFYIVMEGKVEIYKPKFIEINESPKNFLKLLQKIKDNDVDIEKYNRIKNKNAQIFNKLPLEINDNNIHKGFDIMELKQLFFYEIDEKMGEYGIDFTFGDIALIKRARRNATIKAKEDCCCLTITNMEYNRVIFEYQKKILGKEIESFIKTYSFFRHFTNDKMVKLFPKLDEVVISNKDNADAIFVIYNGLCLLNDDNNQNLILLDKGNIVGSESLVNIDENGEIKNNKYLYNLTSKSNNTIIFKFFIKDLNEKTLNALTIQLSTSFIERNNFIQKSEISQQLNKKRLMSKYTMFKKKENINDYISHCMIKKFSPKRAEHSFNHVLKKIRLKEDIENDKQRLTVRTCLFKRNINNIFKKKINQSKSHKNMIELNSKNKKYSSFLNLVKKEKIIKNNFLESLGDLPEYKEEKKEENTTNLERKNSINSNKNPNILDNSANNSFFFTAVAPKKTIYKKL